MKYVVYTKVKSVEHKSDLVSAHKAADGDVVRVTKDLGWFVGLEGSYESLHVGADEPALKVGQRIRLTVEAVPE